MTIEQARKLIEDELDAVNDISLEHINDNAEFRKGVLAGFLKGLIKANALSKNDALELCNEFHPKFKTTLPN